MRANPRPGRRLQTDAQQLPAIEKPRWSGGMEQYGIAPIAMDVGTDTLVCACRADLRHQRPVALH